MAQYADIFYAIWKNDIESVKSFLPKQLELRDKDGRTPLYFACQEGHTEIVRLLLDSGADIGARNNDGMTSLHTACRNSHVKIASLLLDQGADIGALDYGGRTPLHWACLWGNHNMSEFLVMRGADPYTLEINGISALALDALNIWDSSGNKVSHSRILIKIRAEYLANKPTSEEFKYGAARPNLER